MYLFLLFCEFPLITFRRSYRVKSSPWVALLRLAKFRFPRLRSHLGTPKMPADAHGRTTITNASRRACTRASACTRGREPFFFAVVAARCGRRSSNSREIQNKRSRPAMCDRYWPRDSVGGPTRGRGLATASRRMYYLRCILKSSPTSHPRTHVEA